MLKKKENRKYLARRVITVLHFCMIFNIWLSRRKLCLIFLLYKVHCNIDSHITWGNGTSFFMSVIKKSFSNDYTNRFGFIAGLLILGTSVPTWTTSVTPKALPMWLLCIQKESSPLPKVSVTSSPVVIQSPSNTQRPTWIINWLA